MRTVVIVLLLQCALSPFLVVAEQQDRSPAAVLTDGQNECSLASRLEILEDPSGALGIAEVSSAEPARAFTPTGRQTLNLGYSSSAYWFRFRLRDDRTDHDPWFLVLATANIHYVDVYLPSATGYVAKSTGALRPFSTRDLEHHLFAFHLDVPRNIEQTVYVRVKSGASLTVPIRLQSKDSFSPTRDWPTAISGPPGPGGTR